MILRPYQQTGINDIRAAFQRGRRRPLYVLPCGGGKTVTMAYMAQNAARRGNKTYFMVHRRELQDQAETTLQEYGAAATVYSVQTLARRLHKIPAPDLLIIDEAHHATARTWRQVIDAYPGAYVVGLTATPARLNGQGLGDVFDSLIVGPTARELIHQGHLAPYVYYAPPQVADLQNIRIKMGDFDAGEISVRMDKPAVVGDAIAHYARLAAGKRAIVYCASIAHSKNVAAAFAATGILSAHLDGETPAAARRQIIADFKANRLQVLTNCQLVGEGLDVPGCECVILLRPTASLTLYIQMAMRGMRPDKNNPLKTCIILDHVGAAYKHGLPDEDREWSLEGIKKRARNEEPAFSVKCCPRCYSVHKPAGECPFCGWLYAPEPREIKLTPGELQEIKEIERKKARQEVGRCRTVEDLKRIAKERGYAPGWIWKMKQLKGIKA
jgi:DNA repair protein RadD